MRKMSLTLALLLCFAMLPGSALAAEAAIAEAAPASDSAAAATAPEPEVALTDRVGIYIGEIATRIDGSWQGETDFPVKDDIAKNYATMVGNVLRITLYSTVAPGADSDFYVAMDSHIAYMDGSDRFTPVGQSGHFYSYEKQIRIEAPGSFELTVANKNKTLYDGLYDTVAVTAFDTIDSLDFFVEQDAGTSGLMNFYVTANGSSTAFLTSDTTGFNASDNEWKIVTAEKTEKVIFEGTTYDGYTFQPDVISMSIESNASAQENPTTIQVYYLGLINGRLFTVGPYPFPARANIYSSLFELEKQSLDVLATDSTFTFNAYIDSGRTAELTIKDEHGASQILSVESVPSDVDGMDKIAVTVAVSNTSQDLDLLIGNRWSANQVAYNYRTLHIRFLREIQTLMLTATQDDHYHVIYRAIVNGQEELDTQAINWYINGEVQPDHGLTLDCTFNQGGSYTVYAQLGDAVSNEITSQIIHSNRQTMLWYILALIILILAFSSFLRRSRVHGAQYDIKLRRNLQESLDEVEAIRSQLVQDSLTPHDAMRQLFSIRRRFSGLLDGLLERFRETNVQHYQNTADALEAASAAIDRVEHDKATDKYYVRAVLTVCESQLRTALDSMSEISSLLIR